MTIHLNHTIVSARDRDTSARFLSEILGLPAPRIIGPFAVVQVSETSLDFIGTEGAISPQHYAFQVSEVEFDEIFGRIQERAVPYFSDPSGRSIGAINTWDGGRGVYWNDPSGHLLEIITRSYGSGGTTTSNPHPLFAGASKQE